MTLHVRLFFTSLPRNAALTGLRLFAGARVRTFGSTAVMRALAPYSSDHFLLSGSLIALGLFTFQQRVWLVAYARQALAALLAFGGHRSGQR